MLQQQNLQMFGLNLKKYENFHPLEVVGRASDAQLQVGEKLYKITWREKDQCWTNVINGGPTLTTWG